MEVDAIQQWTGNFAQVFLNYARQKMVSKPLKVGYPHKPQTLGEHIKKKRMDLGLYQSDIAKLFNVSNDCITYWESGRHEMQIKYYPLMIVFLEYNPIAIDESTVAGKVFAYRCAQGLSQKKLAKMLGVDPTTVKAWEDGSGFLKKMY